MAQMEEAHLATLPRQKRAAAFTAAGMVFFNQGLILEAEREFHAALLTDDADPDAHAGMALVREQGGDTKEARLEAQAALNTKPNVNAYLVLARLDLQANQKPEAATEVSNALKLEPQNSAARGLKQQLENKGQAVP
jgi:Tfp pilus assembly protein PilF